MKIVLALFILALFLAGCGSYGSHSHYIISHDQASSESQEIR